MKEEEGKKRPHDSSTSAACLSSMPVEVLLGALIHSTARPLSSSVAPPSRTCVRCRACASKSLGTPLSLTLEPVVAQQICSYYGRSSPRLRADCPKWRRSLDTLRVAELQHISWMLSRGGDATVGYWVSRTWSQNLRRYAEGESRRQQQQQEQEQQQEKKKLVGGSGGPKVSPQKPKRGRLRTESNVMPPWPNANEDIQCSVHGGLRGRGRQAASDPNASPFKVKRNAVEVPVWEALRRLFPNSTPFETREGPCAGCGDKKAAAKAVEEKVLESRLVEIQHPILRKLASRKGGVPPWALRSSSSSSSSSGDASSTPTAAGVADAAGAGLFSLLPGIYQLVPRCFLQAWRGYLKDPRAPLPHMLDLSMFLCEGHGLLLVPPHLEEWLSGERRSLLSGRTEDSGVACEIVTDEEWERLTQLYACELGVRFLIPPERHESVQWSVQRCLRCHSGYIGDILDTCKSRKASF